MVGSVIRNAWCVKPGPSPPSLANCASRITNSTRCRITIVGMPNHAHRKIAVFPGQFDPVTNGHLDIIKRGVALFDEVIVAVGINPDKKELFPLDDRLAIISELLKEIKG